MSKEINNEEPKSSLEFRLGSLPDQQKTVDINGDTYKMHYIDSEEKSEIIVYLIHGLGLDHRDFYEFVRTVKYRAVAITLYGSHPTDNTNDSICVDEHATMVEKFIEDHLNPKEEDEKKKTYQKVIIVGFSLGADIVLRIASKTNALVKNDNTHFLLLDPNININTCFISSKIAQITQPDFQKQICDILTQFVNNKTGFNQILNYVNTISPKFYERTEYLSFLARSMICTFQACLKDKNEFFNSMLTQVFNIQENKERVIKIQFSEEKEATDYAGKISQSALPLEVKKHIIDCNVIVLTKYDHFELINSTTLRLTIEKFIDCIDYRTCKGTK